MITSHRSLLEDELQEQVLGTVQEHNASLDADESRIFVDVATVMGSDKDPWSIEEVYDVTKTLRVQFNEKEAAGEGEGTEFK